MIPRPPTPLDPYHTKVTTITNGQIKPSMAQTLPTAQFDPPAEDEVEQSWQSFSAADDNHRYLRKRCAALCEAFNTQPLAVSREERDKAWNDLVNPRTTHGAPPVEAPLIKTPFQVDYGVNVHIAPSAFIHRDCYFQDSVYVPITIGEDTMVGPNVHVLTVAHEVDWRYRHGINGPASAAPVTIGDDCYIGSHVVIMPGVTIGHGCVIGAGAVVTKDIPAGHVALGVPARPVRKVAFDVPNAPGLQYERRGLREVVIEASDIFDGAKIAIHTGTLPAFNSPGSGVASASSNVARPQEAAVDALASTNATEMDEAQRELGHALRSMNREDWMMIGVEGLILLVAVVTAWLIIHTVLN